MRHTDHIRVTTAAACLALALCLGTLVACANTSASSDPDASSGGDAATEQTDGQSGDQATDGDGEDAQTLDDGEGETVSPDEGTTASGTVEVGSFTFDIPAYWAGKIECYTTSDEEGNDKAIVYLPGNTDAELASLTLVAGEEPFSAGDIGRHLAGSIVDGKGNHVEVWTYNWPWLAANASAPDVSDEELAQLVDLSTGGLLSMDALAGEDDETINGAEYGFMAAELVPTVSFG